MTSLWARWRLKSPASRLFTQAFIEAQIKENMKTLRHWPLWGEFTSDRWIPRTKDQYRGKMFPYMMTSSCVSCDFWSTTCSKTTRRATHYSVRHKKDASQRHYRELRHLYELTGILHLSLSYSTWASWRFKSSAVGLFAQQLVRAINKENIKSPCERNPPVTGEFPSQTASYAEGVSMAYERHVQVKWIAYYLCVCLVWCDVCIFERINPIGAEFVLKFSTNRVNSLKDADITSRQTYFHFL